MNKKAFTLVELIIAISIIAIISTSSFILLKNSNKNDSDELTQKVLEAAKVYISIETDEDGNSYEYGIKNGGKGLYLNVDNLVEEGYLDNKVFNDLKNNFNLQSTKYQIFISNSIKNNTDSECETGLLSYTVSWTNNAEPIYLCDYNKKTTPTQPNVLELLNYYKLKVEMNKNAVSKEYYESLSDDKKTAFTPDENNIYVYNAEQTDTVYIYFRGAINNNYLKLGSENGNDLLWRIIWLSDQNKMKLVLDKEIPLEIKNQKGNYIRINSGDKIELYNCSTNYYILNKNSTNIIKDNQLFGYDEINTKINMTNSANPYYKRMLRWYNATNLNSFNYIMGTDNFCENNYYLSKYYSREYHPSNTFDCISGSYSKPSQYGSNISYNQNKYSGKVGFLTYGDVRRAGVTSGTNIVDSGSYLLNDKDMSYPLSDKSEQHFYSSFSESHYFIKNTGISNEDLSLDVVGADYKYFTLTITDDAGNKISTKSCKHQSLFYYFPANSVKPAIVIDMTGKKLEGDGTKDNPFIIKNA